MRSCPTLAPNASYSGYADLGHDQIWLVPPEYTGFCGCVCDQVCTGGARPAAVACCLLCTTCGGRQQHA